MLKSIALKSFLLFTILTITTGTVLAQDGEASSAPGLTLLILMIGIAAIGLIFIVNWSQSSPDDNDS